MNRLRTASLLLLLLVGSSTSVWADATAFVGANTTPVNRRVQGLALGSGLLLLGFEFEYANTSESTDQTSVGPALRTGMANVLLQTPVPIFGLQPYVTTGAGVYRETLGTREHTGFAPNTGFGVKISLAGPLRLRVDYRVFKLGDEALYSPAHRLYAGLNLKF